MNNDIVIINLDRPRRLKFTNSAIKTLLEMTGETLETVDTEFTPQNIAKLEKFAYCGMLFDAKENSEQLSFDRAVELLDEAESWIGIYEKVVAAWTKALTPSVMPGGKQPEPAKPPEEENPTTGKKA